MILVFDQSYGLRFDIYERIHLTEELPGIAELEEVELLPNIQVISQDEQVALRGHLLLTGLYRGDGEEDGTQRLEHFIPVEITVPANRVTSLDEISVEIENFDVDLLSKRSMNITGVLSLRGIETAASEPESSWNADEFTVVHASEDPAEDPVLAAFLEEGELDADEAKAREPHDEAAADEQDAEAFATEGFAAAPKAAGSPGDAEAEAAENEPAAVKRPSEEVAQTEEEPALAALHTDKESGERGGKGKNQPNVWHFEHEDESELLHPEKTAIQADEDTEKDLYLTSVGQDQPFEPAFPFSAFQSESVPQEEAPDEREMRVALGSKKEAESGEKEAIGFSSLLSSSRSQNQQEQQAAPEEPKAEEAERESSASDDIQWQNLFLGSSTEKNQFRKVRLCIVQREETLETIANRYQLTAREILLYNRLSEQTVEEGQILYIP
ncbi:LysM peptidoglycan-binding domain-containing protein [Paenibacillus sp. FSL W8-0194]|uniref:LysM peptidoglycan-binding domain-containing protein n=1 Tax=Paenibacillus sp. FSL W8-0194 TaxID=2921711 RepID=UPI0030DB02E3